MLSTLVCQLAVKTTTMLRTIIIEGDIFKNVLLCQLDVKEAVFKINPTCLPRL